MRRFTSIISGVALLAIAPSLAAGDRALVHETVISAPVADVWEAFTTKEGVESWMTPRADLDFRVGGTMRTSYNPEAPLDGPESIHHRILSFEPQRMIAYQVVKCPEGFEFAEFIEQTWEVVYFEPLGPNRTKLRAVGLGYGEGGQWDRMRAFFDEGNAWTYEQLRKKFASDETPAPDVLTLMHEYVGGHWIHEGTAPDGSLFRARGDLRLGPDGRSIITQGWVGDAEAMFYHGTAQIWRDPRTGETRFQNIADNGDIARGAITLQADGRLSWDWTSRSPDGAVARFLIWMTLPENDRYHLWIHHQPEGGAPVPMVVIEYRRVEELPEAFRTIRAAARLSGVEE